MAAIATQPAPRLDAAGQGALAGIMQIVEQAAKPKPEQHKAMAEEAMRHALQAVLPTLRQAFGQQANAEMARLQQTAQSLIGSFAEAERTLDQRILDLTAEAIWKLAPRTVQVVDAKGVELGRLDEHTRAEFDEIAGCVSIGLNTMLVGPAGCGKTTFAAQVAKGLGLRFGFIGLSAGISEGHLAGRFVPIGEAGRFVYVPATFVDFYENGGLFLLDEVDAADPNVLLVINAALANGHMATPNPAKPIITRHNDFRCMAAANTWGTGADRQYVGRNQLDAATLDRFTASQFELDYDVEFERKAGDAEVVEWVHELRRKVRDGRIRRVVSTRLVLDGSKRVRAGHTLAQVQRSYFLPWTEAERNHVGYSAA